MGDHRKVKILRNKFGQVLGFAFWAMMLSHLTAEDGNEMEYSDIEFEMFAAKLGCTNIQAKEMIDFCIKIELLFCKDNFIWSESLNEKLAPVYEKRNRARDISATRKRRNDGTFGITVTEKPKQQELLITELPQSRLDKSIVNKKKTLSKAEPSTLHGRMVKIYFDWYESSVGVKPMMDQTQGKAMVGIISYLTDISRDSFKKKNHTPTPQEIDDQTILIFQFIFSKWKILDTFYQDQTKLLQIKSNMSNILKQIKDKAVKNTDFPVAVAPPKITETGYSAKDLGLKHPDL